MSSNVELTKQLFNAYGNLDSTTIATFLDDSCKIQILPKSLGNTERGKEEYLGFLSAVQAKMENAKGEILDIHNGGDKITAHATFSAGFKGRSDVAYKSEYILTWTWRDGKVVYMREFVDSIASVELKKALSG